MHEDQLATLAVLFGAALVGCVAAIVALWRSGRSVHFPADEQPKARKA